MTTNFARTALAASALLLLAACGGGSGPGDHGTGQRPPPGERLDGERSSVRNGATLRSGTLRDPNARDGARLAEYFNALDHELVSYIAPTGPVAVRVHGATAAELRTIRTVVAEMNQVLPRSHRISFETGTGPVFQFGDDLPDGMITFHVTSGKGDWPPDWADGNPDAGGVGGLYWTRSVNGGPFSWRAGAALVDRRANGTLKDVIAHEIMHAYGLLCHVDPSRFPSSFMGPYATRSTASSIPTSIDGEALLALVRMMRTPPRPGDLLEPGEITISDFGPWSVTAFHVAGAAGEAEFGASHRNGRVRTWANGDRPGGHVSGSVSGTATWEGALAGFTNTGETVTGDAAITVDVAAMRGSATFDALESWGVDAHPGTPGTGATWGDGGLAYTLGVLSDGLGFRSTGGDAGTVQGVFLGAAHEGAAGTLERDDLQAAFGASR